MDLIYKNKVGIAVRICHLLFVLFFPMIIYSIIRFIISLIGIKPFDITGVHYIPGWVVITYALIILMVLFSPITVTLYCRNKSQLLTILLQLKIVCIPLYRKEIECKDVKLGEITEKFLVYDEVNMCTKTVLCVYQKGDVKEEYVLFNNWFRWFFFIPDKHIEKIYADLKKYMM